AAKNDDARLIISFRGNGDTTKLKLPALNTADLTKDEEPEELPKNPAREEPKSDLRTYTIEMKPEMTAVSWYLPQDRVDVMAVTRDKNETITKTIVLDVLIQAIDSHPEKGNLITLTVTQADAERLNQVRKAGGLLILVKRGPGERVK